MALRSAKAEPRKNHCNKAKDSPLLGPERRVWFELKVWECNTSAPLSISTSQHNAMRDTEDKKKSSFQFQRERKRKFDIFCALALCNLLPTCVKVLLCEQLTATYMRVILCSNFLCICNTSAPLSISTSQHNTPDTGSKKKEFVSVPVRNENLVYFM